MEHTRQQKGEPRNHRTATSGKFTNLKKGQGDPNLYYVRRSDPLITGINIAFEKRRWKGKSFKTRYNHIKEAELFVRLLRWSGYGPKKWTNVTNKHVQVVVDLWRVKGLTPATIKEYLSGVRTVLDHFGNRKVKHDNFHFEIPRRKYIENKDKSLDQITFDGVIERLQTEKRNDQIFALMLRFQRYLGLRIRESLLIRPASTILADGSAYICYGTKGGRERFLSPESLMPQAKKILADASKFVSNHKNKNLIPRDEDLDSIYNKFRNKLYYLGINRNQSGATAHGNRHWYVQSRYQQMTGLLPPCKFDSQAEYQIAAFERLKTDWPKADQMARTSLKIETGHGPDRDDVISQYIGSGGKARIVDEEAFMKAYEKMKMERQTKK